MNAYCRTGAFAKPARICSSHQVTLHTYAIPQDGPDEFARDVQRYQQARTLEDSEATLRTLERWGDLLVPHHRHPRASTANGGR